MGFRVPSPLGLFLDLHLHHALDFRSNVGPVTCHVRTPFDYSVVIRSHASYGNGAAAAEFRSPIRSREWNLRRLSGFVLQSEARNEIYAGSFWISVFVAGVISNVVVVVRA